nr:AAA family ATPase [Nocardioides sp.]
MRLAVAGKGGAGKTTLSATLARLAARSGRQVVAIDADANPNLASALGLPPSEAARLGPVPTSLVSRRQGGAGLTASLDDVLDRYALIAPDGVRLLGMGAPAHADEG